MALAARYAAFSVLAGALLAARPAAARAAGSGSRPIGQSVGQIGDVPWLPVVDPAVGPQETFELNTLDIVRVGEEGWRPNRGKYRSLLSRHDFYVTLGRTDLASHDAGSATTSRVLMWSGYAGLAVGGLLFYAHLSPGGVDPGLTPGFACVAAGGVAVLASGWFTGPLVSQAEAEEMARRYNERLRAHLQHGGDDDRPQPVQALAPRVLPWTDGRSGGGILAVGAF
jgi:hypothetical protein